MHNNVYVYITKKHWLIGDIFISHKCDIINTYVLLILITINLFYISTYIIYPYYSRINIWFYAISIYCKINYLLIIVYNLF